MSTINPKCGHYVTPDGTHNNAHTSPVVASLLDALRLTQTRVRIYYDYGNGITDPPEVGYIGRSFGPCKWPLIIYNRRSLGGGAIITHRIARIEATRGGRVIYSKEATPCHQPS